MKYFDEEEYVREKRDAKRKFWSTLVLLGIGGIIAFGTLARTTRQKGVS